MLPLRTHFKGCSDPANRFYIGSPSGRLLGPKTPACHCIRSMKGVSVHGLRQSCPQAGTSACLGCLELLWTF